MKFAFAAGLLAAASVAIETSELDFLKYMIEYGKSYSTSEEFAMRLAQWAKTEAFIKGHQSAFSEMKHNEMSDWTEEEWAQIENPIEMDDSEWDNLPVMGEANYPSSVDWRSKGKCTAIKDQRSCGSCWAFAATAVIESSEAIKHGDLKVLAPQQFVNCLCSGCGGGNPQACYKHLEKHNAYLEKNMPYQGREQKCVNDDSKAGTKIRTKSYGNVSRDSPSSMKSQIAQQPITVAINSSCRAFHSLGSGILTKQDCPNSYSSTTHIVAIVGYGHDSKKNMDYWIVRNSWGTSWGDNGYGRVQITSGDGICLFNKYPSYPVMA